MTILFLSHSHQQCSAFRQALFALLFVLLAALGAGCAAGEVRTVQPTTAALPAPSDSDELTVAWVEAGNLIVWQSPDTSPRRIASGGVVQPFIAPDAAQIAFTRGPGGAAETLWVVDIAGTAERQLVAREDLPVSEQGHVLIYQVVWANSDTLLFNTLVTAPVSSIAQDDLYRASASSGAVTQVLSPGRGGRFTLSPDSSLLAIVNPGIYNDVDGEIRVLSASPTTGAQPVALHRFPAVATGAEYRFYPAVFWEPDSSTLRVALPPADLIYTEDETQLTVLWRIPVANPGARAEIGRVPASLFGQPAWSATGSYMTYLRRDGGPQSNRFDLMLANGTGTNAQQYASGDATRLQPPLWIADSERFVYWEGTPGTAWLGGMDTAPQRLPNADETLLAPRFTGGTSYVFSTVPQGHTSGNVDGELRYARFDQIGAPSTLISRVSTPLPVFDVLLTTVP